MKKCFLVFFIILFICSVLSAKSFHARNYNSTIKVMENGNMQITEVFEYEFEGGPFTWVKRVVPSSYTDGLEFISAAYTIDGHKQEIDAQLKNERRLKVKWEFPQVSDTAVTFELRYMVFGGVFEKDNEQFVRWRPIPSEHDFRIDRAQISMFLPSAPDNITILDSGRKDVKAGKSGKHIWWECADLKSDQSFVAKISIPAGTLMIEQPVWQKNKERISEFHGVFVWLGILAIAGLIAVLVKLIIADSKLKKMYAPTETPSDLLEMHPGLVAKIINGFDGSTIPVAAIFFRLLKQKHVYIKKIGKKNYEFELSDNVPENEFDRYFYDELSEHAAQGKTELKKLFSSLDKFKSKFSKILNRWHEDNGYASYEERKRQNRLTIYIVFSIALMFIFLVVGLIQLEGGVVITLMSAFLFWYISLFFISKLSDINSYTPNGYQLRYSWKIWVKELKKELKEKRLDVDNQDFDTMFPYVMINGLAESYINYFKKNGIDVSDSILLKSFEDLEAFYGFMVWYIAIANSTGSTGAGGAAGGASAGGGSASAG